MRKEINRALDAEQAKDRRKVIVAVGSVAGVLMVIGAALFPVSSESVYGVTETFSASQSEDGAKPRVVVKLESGRQVVAKMPRHINFRKGVKVEIMEGRSLLGRHSYRFVRYVE